MQCNRCLLLTGARQHEKLTLDHLSQHNDIRPVFRNRRRNKSLQNQSGTLTCTSTAIAINKLDLRAWLDFFTSSSVEAHIRESHTSFRPKIETATNRFAESQSRVQSNCAIYEPVAADRARTVLKQQQQLALECHDRRCCLNEARLEL